MKRTFETPEISQLIKNFAITAKRLDGQKRDLMMHFGIFSKVRNG